MPMDRAVPSMVRIAASTEPAVMSCIFIFAICSTCLRVTFPTFSLPGVCAPEPFFFSVWRPAAFLRRIAAGGVLSWKVKERSAYTVMMTGMMSASFACACVAALNCLQNSMMLTPCWPSAGPTGGAGFAFPAGSCSLICPVTFFIGIFPDPASSPAWWLRAPLFHAPCALLRLLHLHEVELDGRRAPEDRHEDPDLALVRLDL